MADDGANVMASAVPSAEGRAGNSTLATKRRVDMRIDGVVAGACCCCMYGVGRTVRIGPGLGLGECPGVKGLVVRLAD